MNRTAEDGFVLVAVLFFVALLAFVAVIIEGWVSTGLDRAFALQQRVASHSALVSAANRVAFALVSFHVGVRGLELASAQDATAESSPTPVAAQTPYIALDGRPYRLGDVVISLQDEAGLYDLNRPDRGTLAKLLGRYRVASREGEQLAARLTDYLATPRDRQSSAAERDADYRAAGLPQPRHAPMLTPWEPYRVLGWRGAKSLWQGPYALPEIITIGPIGGLNPNTAPATVLAALTGIDEPGAARFVAYRAIHPITNRADFQAASGVRAGEELPLTFIPSNIVRMTAIAAGDPLVHLITVRLTPRGAAPVRVDYAVDLPLEPASRAMIAATAAPRLPLPQ